ncbi:hypothetical protein [Nocardia otitidiscaviarum]|uniref:hypothetical protein n=1 Tax=Nocardia otitidiscaviarum TaxID=1823 RepID=UPI002454936B|nr:hypothetical protein [Nocardia otitidiscaviarum]
MLESSSVDPGTFLLRQPFLYLQFGASLAAVFTSVILLGIITEESELTLYGIIGLAVVLPGTALFAWYRQNSSITLSQHSVRFMTPILDWEFPWESITAFGSGDNGQNSAAVTIHCPSTAVIIRRSLLPTPANSLPSQSSADGPWKVVPAVWGATPNSLISALVYLRGNKAERHSLTRDEIVAMLTPPTLRRHQWLIAPADARAASSPEFRFPE